MTRHKIIIDVLYRTHRGMVSLLSQIPGEENPKRVIYCQLYMRETNEANQQSIITQSALLLLFPPRFHAVYNPTNMTPFTGEICFLSDL